MNENCFLMKSNGKSIEKILEEISLLFLQIEKLEEKKIDLKQFIIIS
jgi:hypothetical protein